MAKTGRKCINLPKNLHDETSAFIFVKNSNKNNRKQRSKQGGFWTGEANESTGTGS